MLSSCGFGQIIGRYMAGHSLVVSRERRTSKQAKASRAELERLEAMDEIWALCYRQPRPGWRLVGRFMEPNLLALFRACDKRDIGNDYTAVANEVIADWTRRFGSQPPHRGDWISGYLSGSHYDVDERAVI
jgi:hypothetical protein